MKTEFRKTGGQDSPMTYGDENLDEEPLEPLGNPSSGMEVEQPLYGEEEQAPDMNSESGDMDEDEAMDMISVIKYMNLFVFDQVRRIH